MFDVVYVSGPNFPSVQMMRLGILFNNFHNVQALLLAIFTSLFFSGIFGVGARLIIYLLASPTPTLFAIERQQLQNSWSKDVMSGNAYRKGEAYEANDANKC